MVNPTEYGKLAIFNMYESIALMIICAGLDQALVRFFYEDDSDDYRHVLLFRCLKLPIVICVCVFLIIILLSTSGFVHFKFSFEILILWCLYCFCGVVYRFSQLVVRLSYQSKLYSLLNIIQKLSYVGCAVLLLSITYIDDFFILAFSTFTSYFLCMLISIVAQKNMWSIEYNNNSKCSVSYRELLKYSYPYIFSMGITTLFQAIDKLSLNFYCSYEEVGIYSSTMTLIHIFAVVQTTFNTLWAPMAIDHYTKDCKDKSFYRKGNQCITVIMFFIGISLIVCKDIFAILLGEKYREAAYILPFLIFNPIMYTISETTVSGLVFMKKSKMHIIVAVGACITNFIGNTILVPVYGCKGAAISTGISYIVFFTLRTFLSNHYFKINFHLKKFYSITLAVSVYALYNTFVKFNVGSVIGYFICTLILLFLYVDTVKWGFKYIRKSFRKLIRRNKNWKY